MNVLKYLFLGITLIILISCSSLFSQKNSKRSIAAAKIPSMQILPLDQQIANIDEGKPTVCSMTLNSENERNIFNYFLNKEFNFIEFIIDKDNPTDSWFNNACQSEVRCDILVVSAHYADTFFSEKHKVRIHSSTLEKKSCARPGERLPCHGVLQNPKEVYLFGCNTTAGKNKDTRNLTVYTNDLISDGLSPETAREVSLFRYSKFGRKAFTKMKTIFKSAIIYGFKTKAPLGYQIEPALIKYFNSFKKGYYQSHFSKITKNSTNPAWIEMARSGHWEVNTVLGDSSLNAPTCELYGDNSITEKLLWVENILRSEEALTFIPDIYNFYINYLKKLYGEDLKTLPPKAKIIQNRIRNYKPLKEKLIQSIIFDSSGNSSQKITLKTPIPGSMNFQGLIMKYLNGIGIYSKEKSALLFKDFSMQLLSKNSEFLVEDYKFICDYAGFFSLLNWNIKAHNIHKSPTVKRAFNYNMLRAIKCIKPQDPSFITELLKMRDSGTLDNLILAATNKALNAIDPKKYPLK